jgi:phage FluMu protein Com
LTSPQAEFILPLPGDIMKHVDCDGDIVKENNSYRCDKCNKVGYKAESVDEGYTILYSKPGSSITEIMLTCPKCKEFYEITKRIEEEMKNSFDIRDVDGVKINIKKNLLFHCPHCNDFHWYYPE